MKIKLFVSAAVVAILLSAATSAQADRCHASSDFLKSYPANEIPSKFKFKFRVESDECTRYACRGYVKYTIHYQYKDGDSNKNSSLVSYTIRPGDGETEVTDEHYPSGSSTKIQIRDVDVTEVTCATP